MTALSFSGSPATLRSPITSSRGYFLGRIVSFNPKITYGACCLLLLTGCCGRLSAQHPEPLKNADASQETHEGAAGTLPDAPLPRSPSQALPGPSSTSGTAWSHGPPRPLSQNRTRGLGNRSHLHRGNGSEPYTGTRPSSTFSPTCSWTQFRVGSLGTMWPVRIIPAVLRNHPRHLHLQSVAGPRQDERSVMLALCKSHPARL